MRKVSQHCPMGGIACLRIGNSTTRDQVWHGCCASEPHWIGWFRAAKAAPSAAAAHLLVFGVPAYRARSHSPRRLKRRCSHSPIDALVHFVVGCGLRHQIPIQIALHPDVIKYLPDIGAVGDDISMVITFLPLPKNKAALVKHLAQF